MSFDFDNLIEGSLSNVKSKEVWSIDIECDAGDADYVYKNIKYTDEEFKEEGLPIVLILRKLDKSLYMYNWVDKVLYGDDYIDDWLPYDIHRVTKVTASRDGHEFNMSSISDNVARKIVEDFLRSELFEGDDFTDDYINEVLDDIYPLTNKKTNENNSIENSDKDDLEPNTSASASNPVEQLDEDKKNILASINSEEDKPQDDIVYLHTAITGSGEITEVRPNGIYYFNGTYQQMSFFPGIDYSKCHVGQKVQESKLTPIIEYIDTNGDEEVILKTDYYGYGYDYYIEHYGAGIYPQSKLRGILGVGVITDVLEDNNGIIIRLDDNREVICDIPLDYSKCFPGEKITIDENHPYMEIGKRKNIKPEDTQIAKAK